MGYGLLAFIGYATDATDERPTCYGGTRPNKGMKLTKLSAAPGRMERRLMPAPSHSGAGTASQLIPGVRPTVAGAARGGSPGRTRREGPCSLTKWLRRPLIWLG
jgi:hypothetical protein